ncbi:MAG: hypothetical protein NTW45_10405 [Rhodocyclales bacterium]|nr:hypothetical protein [Rhodocyclales bacterium]
MTPVLSIFKRARRPLNVLAGTIFLSLTLVLGSIYGRDTLRKSLTQSRSQLGAQQPNLTAKQQDLRNVQAHVEQFRVFRAQGLVGRADREGWVEQLVASRERLKLADTLSYVLKPPQAITESGAPDPATAEPAAIAQGGANSDAPATHDLDFELSGIHEQELLDLLEDYRTMVRGRFRVQACHLGSAQQIGLLAQCTLRFFNLPEVVKPPGA